MLKFDEDCGPSAKKKKKKWLGSQVFFINRVQHGAEMQSEVGGGWTARWPLRCEFIQQTITEDPCVPGPQLHGTPSVMAKLQVA